MRLHWFTSARSSPGPGRGLLRRLGESWSASPFRRLVQTGFFLLFVYLFFHVAWPYGSTDFARLLRDKEVLDAEFFLMIDPLVGASAALSGRMWVDALAWGAAALAVCLALPRFFCGYACPLGTLVDLFDWAVNRPVRALVRAVAGRRRRDRNAPGTRGGDRPAAVSPWRHARYFLLAGVLASAASGVLLAGYVSPIPVVTRGLQFSLSLLELGLRLGWHQVPPLGGTYAISLGLFAAVLALGIFRARFWCRYICPSGAMFSLVNRLGLMRRHVTADCTGCGRCGKACSFDAVDVDFATRVGECAFCQTCGGVCPVGAIHFAGNGSAPAGRPVRQRSQEALAAGTDPVMCAGEGAADPPEPRGASPVPPGGRFSRRGFLTGLAAGGAMGMAGAWGVRAASARPGAMPVRPPGSVPEREFLRLCIRCGECFRACPNNVLQPMGLSAGVDNLWTPAVVAEWSGCEPSCNNCGQVCPTGAIRALTPQEKRATRIALAVVDEQTCLQCRGQSACQTSGRDGRESLLCRDECEAAGYHAIDLIRMGVETDASGVPLEGTGYLVPRVVEDKCIGCGLCHTRCYRINAKEKGLLRDTAIRVVAGEGREDRLLRGMAAGPRSQGASVPVTTEKNPPAGTTRPGDYVTDF